MKKRKELLEMFKSHLNTKIMIGFFVLEFVILVVLFVVVANLGIRKDGSYALRDILKHAGNGSVLQYSDMNTAVSGHGKFESVLGKYTTDEITLISSVSPSFAGFLQHEYNVKNYVSVKENVVDNKVDTPSSVDQSEATKYKFYQFVLNADSYHTDVIIDDATSIPAGVPIDNYGGSMDVKHGEDFIYGDLTIKDTNYIPEFNLKTILQKPLIIPMNKDNLPSVLLYYTHTSEGYCTTESDKYALKDTATDDSTKNVVACGNVITDILKNKHGVSVINDTTKNDVSYDDAYTASEKLVNGQIDKNTSVDVVIDIHRDSFVVNGKKNDATVMHENKKYAPIMFVMSADNKNFESNVKLAMILIEKMEAAVPGITKGISLRNNDKYNSEATNKGLLIEIGFSGNYTEEATNTAEVFAEALGEVYGANER